MGEATTSSSSQEDLICRMCGNKGYTNAFVYCGKCLDSVAHRYCLDKITYDEFIRWFCEDCKTAPPKLSTLDKVKASRSQEEDAPVHLKLTHPKKKRKKERKLASLLGREVVNLQEETTEHDHECILDSRQRQTVVCVVARAEESEGDKRLEVTEHDKGLSDSSSLEEESDKKTKDHEFQAETAKQMQIIQHSRASSADFASNIGVDNYPAQPVLEPVWRGSFDVIHTDYDLFEGFIAHLSSKACSKVCEEANVLPSMLCLEMKPKTVLWPKSFQESQPTDGNIALYFFPGEKSERAYDHLVLDMMDEELAMRATTNNAELLIFTSNDLPQLFRRFRGKYYLWGVFRAKKRDESLALVNQDLMDQNTNNMPGGSSNSQDEASNRTKSLDRVKILDARSPQSPLSNIGENGMDTGPESGE